MPTASRPRAVVFGGAGFIGTHLINVLFAEGYDVTIADLTFPAEPVPNGVRKEIVDVRRPIVLSDTRPDVVFNLAAVHRTPGHPDHEYYDTNVAGALNVTRWSSNVGARSMVFTSSISVYGPTEELKDEEAELSPTSSYGRSKVLAEQIHREWAETSDRKLVIARPAVVFGPGEHGNFTRLANALSRRRFLYPGRDDTVKACGYVSDLVRSLLFGLGRPARQYVFNFCYPRAYTIREICEAFERTAGYSPPIHVPSIAIKTAVKALDWTHASNYRYLRGPSTDRIRKLTASTNISPRALQDSGFVWETTLHSGLKAWLASDPQGVFA